MDEPNRQPMPAPGGFRNTYQNSGGNYSGGNPRAGQQMGIRDFGDPEGVFPSMKSFLMPDFNTSYFLFYMTAAQVIMFAVELIYAEYEYGEPFNKDNTTAGPGTATMRDLGGKDTYLIQHGEVFRLVTPIFLHGGIEHIFFNLVFQIWLCFTYEKDWGFYRTGIFYFMTGIGACLMSAVCNTHDVSVGASGALSGMLGARLSYIFLNWNDPNKQMLSGGDGPPMSVYAMELCNLVCIILINFTLGFTGSDSGNTIDNYAHLGGLIAGIIIGLGWSAHSYGPVSMCEPGSNAKYAGQFLSLGYFGLMTYLCFTVKT